MNNFKPILACSLAVAAVAAMTAIAPPSDGSQNEAAESVPVPSTVQHSKTPATTKLAPVQAEPVPPLPLEMFNCSEDLSILGQTADRPTRLPGEALPPEALTQALAVARDLDPDLARKLSNLCAEHPAQFEQMIRASGQRLVAMGELKQRDPQLYGYKLSELRHEMQVRKLSADLTRALASSDESQARVIEEQLRTVLRLQLALSIKARAEYLCRLEQHIQKVKDEIAREAADFNLTVEKRYQQVLAEASGKTAAGSPVIAADAAQPARAIDADAHSEAEPEPGAGAGRPVPAAPR